MPVGPVDDQGNIIFFQDSGTPPCDGASTYTTLILIPGTGYQGSIFQRLFPIASQNNLRLIAVNRRGFSGSSSISPEELSLLDASNAVSAAQYLKKRSLGLAHFIAWLVDEYDLPPISDDGFQGGVGVLGWSLGTVFCVTFFAFAEEIPKSTARKIEPYLRSTILLDPPVWSLGIPFPPNYVDHLQDKSIPEEERATAFNDWVSGYFQHNSLTSRDHNDLEKTLPDSRKHLSTLNKGDAQLAMTIDLDAESGGVPKCDVLIRATPLTLMAEITRRALLDDKLALEYFPRLKVSLVWGENTTWVAASGSQNLERLYEDFKAEGGVGRRFESILIPKANHFPHWDLPDETMRVLRDVLTS